MVREDSKLQLVREDSKLTFKFKVWSVKTSKLNLAKKTYWAGCKKDPLGMLQKRPTGHVVKKTHWARCKKDPLGTL